MVNTWRYSALAGYDMLEEYGIKLDNEKPWYAPAFCMIDDIYFLGAGRNSIHMIASEEGHILIDAGSADQGPLILKGMIDLGFNPRDVKYVLLTHSDGDHTGSAGFLAEETGAKVCIGKADVKDCGNPSRFWLERGLSPFKIDIPLKEGDTMKLGGNEIHVYDTPGHTPGCCSFGWKIEHEGQINNVFIFGGPGIPTPLIMKKILRRQGLNDAEIQNMIGDKLETCGDAFKKLKNTLERLETFQVDVWLAAHPLQNNTLGKLELLRKDVRPNPFIDPEGYKGYIRQRKQAVAREADYRES